MSFKKPVQKCIFQLYRVVNGVHGDVQVPHLKGGLDEMQRKYQSNKVVNMGQWN